MTTRVIVLRPEPGASETARRARERGLTAEAMPLFEIEPIPWEVPSADYDGLLLTSANAVRHGGGTLQQLRRLPVHAVGQATAEAARAAGFDVVNAGNGGVDTLLQSISPDLKLLHVCGADRKIPDAAQRIVAVPVYRAIEQALDVSELRHVVALIHSPRAGRRFAELVADRQTIAIAAISSAAADAVGTGWTSVAAADQPTDEALLALAARLCNTWPPA